MRQTLPQKLAIIASAERFFALAASEVVTPDNKRLQVIIRQSVANTLRTKKLTARIVEILKKDKKFVRPKRMVITKWLARWLPKIPVGKRKILLERYNALVAAFKKPIEVTSLPSANSLWQKVKLLGRLFAFVGLLFLFFIVLVNAGSLLVAMLTGNAVLALIMVLAAAWWFSINPISMIINILRFMGREISLTWRDVNRPLTATAANATAADWQRMAKLLTIVVASPRVAASAIPALRRKLVSHEKHSKKGKRVK